MTAARSKQRAARCGNVRRISAAPHPSLEGAGAAGAAGFKVRQNSEIEGARKLAIENKPDFKNPNREPVISVMDLARLDDAEVEAGYRDGAVGEACGDNRSRSYWHGWRVGSLDRGRREKDIWDGMLAGNAAPRGDINSLPGRIAACREVLRQCGSEAGL